MTLLLLLLLIILNLLILVNVYLKTSSCWFFVIAKNIKIYYNIISIGEINHMNNTELLARFTESRENDASEIIGAFGYGSGVFKQEGNNPSAIDLIFVVNNPHDWHKANMEVNPSDYSLTGRMVLKSFDLNQIKALTGVTYQYNIHFEKAKFKYGIVGERRFLKNLRQWDRFFIPGRFQKPILQIRSNKYIDNAIETNRNYALLVALMTMQTSTPTLRDLFVQICGLSYKGDIRMLFAENPNKINNIVDSNFAEFCSIYGTKTKYYHTEQDGKLVIYYDEVFADMWDLPDKLFEYLYSHDCMRSTYPEIRTGIEKYLTHLNKKDSIAQPFTGILTIGPKSSFGYLRQKIKKRFN